MKEKLKGSSLLLISVIALLVGCSEDSNIKDEMNKPQSPDNLYSLILDMGYSADQIEDSGNFYIVDGDLVFDKAKYENIPVTKSRRNRYMVTKPVINVWINPRMSYDWINASKTAIRRWNNVLETIRFNIVNSKYQADIEIQYDTQETDYYSILPLGPYVLGSVEGFPMSDGYPNGKVWLNEDFSACGYLTDELKTSNVQHELGHTIGFHHSNSNYGYHIQGTPTNDPNSLMNGESACSLNNFTSGDIDAVKIMYGRK